MADDEEVNYFFDGESVARVLRAPLNGRLCKRVITLAKDGRIYSCRECFKDAVEGEQTPVCAEIPKWGIILVDSDEKIDVECSRLIANINPSFLTRPTIYHRKLTVIAKCRLHGCVLVCDDNGLASSSMQNICDQLAYGYETFDDLFGNL